MGGSNSTATALGAVAALSSLERVGTKIIEHAEDVSTSAALVALPRAMDPVRLVGDEDKHATLLFFGEIGTLGEDAKSEILTTARQVAQMVGPFSERIVEIKRLGSDDPPALVAMLSGSSLRNLNQVFQVNPKVKGYLENTAQYPEYTPHVTFGYPDYAGEEEIRKSAAQLYRIQFDRLALWWGNEQIEVPLTSQFDGGESDAAWSEDMVENFLAHYGRRGMKWGQHIFTSGKGGSSSSSKSGSGHSPSEDFSKAASALSKPSHALSNTEMQALITRLNLEKQYSQLVSSPKPATRGSKAKKFVSDLLLDVGRTELTRVAKGAAAIQVERAISKEAHGDKAFKDVLAKRIQPSKK